MQVRLLTIALLSCQLGAQARQAKVAVAEVAEPVLIRLTNPDKKHEMFRTIEITEGNRHFRMTPRNPISCIPASEQERAQRGFLSERVDGMVLHPSRCFFRGEYGNPSRHTLLAFVSEPGIGATPVYVLAFQADGAPFEVLQSTELDLIALQSTDSDSARLIGQPTLSQVMSGEGGAGSRTPYATTYDPAYVYLVHAGSKAVYSLQASRDYNQLHYVWAGSHVREDYAVVFNLPGHSRPFGIPAKQLDATMAKASTAHKQ